jgi:uncharacterized protein
VQSFKPASTSKIALLLPLNGQAAVFGRTIQQGFEAAKNMGTQRRERTAAVADPGGTGGKRERRGQPVRR